eukprot:6212415-Pyramimonas_sp.AAC.1
MGRFSTSDAAQVSSCVTSSVVATQSGGGSTVRGMPAATHDSFAGSHVCTEAALQGARGGDVCSRQS